MGAFKAYDIRGIYGKDFDGRTVYRIGRFLPGLLRADRVLVGRDARESSPEVFRELVRGITESGAAVMDLGLSTTPLVYYATARYGFPASVQITASHNPKEYNGLKISRSEAIPVGYDSGLSELESLVKDGKLPPPAAPAKVTAFDAKPDYLEFLKRYQPSYSIRLAIDCSNGMSSLFVRELFGNAPLYLFEEIDGRFPNHEPNPLEEENVQALKDAVLENRCDLGIIFDGDADRVMFVAARGRFISPDLIIGVIGRYYLSREKGPVLHDIRTSRAVSEYIESLGGTPVMWKVGHAFAKTKLREIGGIFGGELAGHYYFRDFYYCDSGILAFLIVLSVVEELRREGIPFSRFIDSIGKYAFSGERNFRIEKKREAMEALKVRFTEGEKPVRVSDFDGYRIEFTDWWFNVRLSNTEPYLRLVVEAETTSLLEERLAVLTGILSRFS